jgi:hypothetical protein
MTAGEWLLAIREAQETVWFAPWRLRLGYRISKSTTSLTSYRRANESANVPRLEVIFRKQGSLLWRQDFRAVHPLKLREKCPALNGLAPFRR